MNFFNISSVFLFAGLIVFPSFVKGQGQVDETSGDWTSLYQKIDISSFESDREFRITGYAQAVGCHDQSRAGLWARVNDDEEGTIFFDNMASNPIKEPTWQKYELTGTIEKRADEFHFGILLLGSGDFYFDDIDLQVKSETGQWESIKLDNRDFESDISNDQVSGWKEGIADTRLMNIRQYTFENSDDSPNTGRSILIRGSSEIKPSQGAQLRAGAGEKQHIESLIFMLEDMKSRVERQVQNLTQDQTDYLIDEEANSIGALIYHLAATEVTYQAWTFEKRSYNEEEEELFGAAMSLGEKGRENIKGQDIQYYLDIWEEVRQKTIDGLRQKDDAWLNEEIEGTAWTNYYSWYHVMEHQSSHLGQILFLSKRLPELKG